MTQWDGNSRAVACAAHACEPNQHCWNNVMAGSRRVVCRRNVGAVSETGTCAATARVQANHQPTTAGTTGWLVELSSTLPRSY